MSKQIAVRLPDDVVDFVDDPRSLDRAACRCGKRSGRAVGRELRQHHHNPVGALGAQIGVLLDTQEQALGDAIRAAFDLD
jgi:hypothetical protein